MRKQKVQPVTDGAREEIRKASVTNIPVNPSERGMTATELQRRFVEPVVGEVSAVAELNRIVDETETALSELDDNAESERLRMGGEVARLESRITPLEETRGEVQEAMRLSGEMLRAAETAVKTANAAASTASAMSGKADTAVTVSGEARTLASEAKTVAEGIDGKAAEALTLSREAKETANGAKTVADGLDGKIEQKVSELVSSAPETLDTLQELAAALGDDPNFATTVSNLIGTLKSNTETALSEIDIKTNVNKEELNEIHKMIESIQALTKPPDYSDAGLVGNPSVTIAEDGRLKFSHLKGEPGVNGMQIYGVRIDTTDSNPETACEYTDSAVGMLPARGNNGAFNGGDWLTRYPFNQIKPCLFKDGAVVGYLNPNNFAQFEDGSTADITSGNAGDVMIEIPKFYYKIARNGNYIEVKIANAFMAGFTDYAFSYKGAVKDKFYIGAYLGYKDGNGKLRSLTGKTVTGNITIGAARTAAQANGAGYEQLAFNKLTALQVLYLMMFKNLNSQAALGQGYSDNSSAYRNTGITDKKGMTYGTNAVDTVKFLGIEDFYGNLYQWIDGFVAASGMIKISDGDFNDMGAGYEEHVVANTDFGGFLTDVMGDNKLAFTPKKANGSAATYYCDYCYIDAGCVPFFGGYRSSGADAGTFFFYCSYPATNAYPTAGARLCFCG